MVKLLFSLILSSLCILSAEANQKPLITVYGLNNVAKVAETSQFSYMLQIASYSLRKDAVQCKKQYLGKINEEIRVLTPRPGHQVFTVVVGPFESAKALRLAAVKLGGSKVLNTAKAKPVQKNPPKQLVSKVEQKTVIAPKVIPSKKVLSAAEEDDLHAIENKMFTLRYQLARIEEHLANEKNPDTLASLEKQRFDLNRELDLIIATVIKRVNRA